MPHAIRKKHIYVLLGKSNAGKTTCLKKILKTYPKLNRLITTTDRPPRTNEQNNHDYYFVDQTYFQTHQLLAPRIYVDSKEQTYQYGIDPAKLKGNSIVILDYQGFIDLCNLIDTRYKIYGFYLDTPEDIRYQRALTRDHDRKQIKQRFMKDDQQFKDINNDHRVIITTENDILNDLRPFI